MCTQRGDAVLSSGELVANDAQAIELAVQLNAYAQQRVRQICWPCCRLSRQTATRPRGHFLPVPYLGTPIVQTPTGNGMNSAIHWHVQGKSYLQAGRIASRNSSTLASASLDLIELLVKNLKIPVDHLVHATDWGERNRKEAGVEREGMEAGKERKGKEQGKVRE
eukprot:1102722-Pelagomonas_calceolata.AAC.3